MENALGWLVPSFTSLQNFRSKLSPRPRFTHSSFIPQKVVTWFLKAFNLLCELFRPILTRSFEPTNLPFVDSCSEWLKITTSTKVDKTSWAVAAMVPMNLSWPLISLTCSGDLFARGYKFPREGSCWWVCVLMSEFFFVIKFFAWILFRPLHEYFLGLIGVHEIFFI